MKLFDQNTSDIAAAAAAVLEGKVAEAIDQKDYTVGAEKTKKGYRPMVKHTEKGHTMYLAGVSYKDEKTAVAHAQAYLDAYAARGDRAANNAVADFRKKNAKNVVEVAEPEAQGEKDFKAKHAVKKVGRTGEDDDVTVDEEQDVCENCGKVHEGACSESVDESLSEDMHGFTTKTLKRHMKNNLARAVKQGVAEVRTVKFLKNKQAFEVVMTQTAALHIEKALEGTPFEKVDSKEVQHSGMTHRKITIVAKKGIEESVKNEESDKLDESLLGEKKVNIQVIDPEDAIKALKNFGVRATADKRIDDEVVVDTKDKKKVLSWMLKSGWDKEDIEDIYPELMEGMSEESDKQKKYQAFFQKALKKFGVKSPQELEKDKRAEFFDYVDANYEADNETD